MKKMAEISFGIKSDLSAAIMNRKELITFKK